MKKIKFLFLAFATVCFIGLYGCKSTPKEEKAAEDVEAVEEAVADSTEVAEEAEAVEEEK